MAAVFTNWSGAIFFVSWLIKSGSVTETYLVISTLGDLSKGGFTNTGQIAGLLNSSDF